MMRQALAAALGAAVVLAAGSAVADPGDPGKQPNERKAGDVDRSREYSICNHTGLDLDLVNLFTDAANMFSDYPQARGAAAYPVISTLRDNTCQHWQYGIAMHNTHNTSAVYMNTARTVVVNLRGMILPSNDGDNWHTNTEFRYVVDTRGYAGPAISVKADQSSRRVNLTAGGVGDAPGDAPDRGSSTGSGDWGSIGSGSRDRDRGSHDRGGRS
ncbi:hypothetical protein nbrc107696_41770 [Gordonia spumicola]|uniref:Uncharacterized protein n=1 Tax=Gordonia spumicola TaxID=589161 RepID=A0A7I9VF26_9ACTN|nr:hypothetical protein [Gordonia spumicola]GEE03731.1 hypothetical protein nbrc107696_41770 [Gordonia spumicola]